MWPHHNSSWGKARLLRLFSSSVSRSPEFMSKLNHWIQCCDVVVWDICSWDLESPQCNQAKRNFICRTWSIKNGIWEIQQIQILFCSFQKQCPNYSGESTHASVDIFIILFGHENCGLTTSITLFYTDAHHKWNCIHPYYTPHPNYTWGQNKPNHQG